MLDAQFKSHKRLIFKHSPDLEIHVGLSAATRTLCQRPVKLKNRKGVWVKQKHNQGAFLDLDKDGGYQTF